MRPCHNPNVTKVPSMMFMRDVDHDDGSGHQTARSVFAA